MAKFYVMSKKGVNDSCVNEKYMDRYIKRGYVNTGKLCGGSGASDIAYFESQRVTSAPSNDAPVNTQINNVSAPSSNTVNPNAINLDLSNINTGTITTVLYGLIVIWFINLLRGVF